jgi:acyl-CoA dehydrogenase
VQVHGGMGFIEETGAALYMRDARIAQIYEGTNGIQAIDLVMRKLPQSDGACVATYSTNWSDVIGELSASNNPAFGRPPSGCRQAMADLRAATEALGDAQGRRHLGRAGRRDALSAAVRVCLGRRLSRKSALADAENAERAALCRFFAENLSGETAGLRRTVETGAASLHEAGEFLVA